MLFCNARKKEMFPAMFKPDIVYIGMYLTFSILQAVIMI